MSYTPSVNANTLELYLGICATGRARAGNTTLDNVAFGTVYNPRPSITFTADDVGMPIAIVGGGPVDALMPPVYFVQGALFHTTIAAYVSPTEVTLTDAPTTAIWNTGFATVILYRPCPFAADVAGVPSAFKYDSSIAPGTSDTLQFSVLNSLGGVLGEDNPYVDRFGPVLLGQPVYLHSTDSSVGDIFGGYIDTLTTSSQPGVPNVPYCWSATCVSWTGLAKRRVVPPAIPQTFADVAGDIVFRTLVLDYLSDDGIAVSTTTAPAITLAAPVGANIGQLLDQVVTLISTADTAWYWTSDPWRTFILATRTASAAPWDVSDGSDLFAGQTPYLQSLVQTHNQLANNVYIIGTNTLLNTLNATVTGNGSATTFNLPEAVGSAPTIVLNGSTPQTVGVLGVNAGQDWYWSQGSAVLTQATGGTPLASTDSLLVTYTPETPAVAMAPNAGSLQMLQAIEGTSANYDYSATLTQPILPDDLLAFATAYELEYGEPATTCQFYTLWPGLAAGQLQTIALPDAGVPSGSYLIATVEMTTVDNVIVWQYTAFGGANIGNAITQLTQFINREQATLSIITPTVPIQSPGGPPQDFVLAYNGGSRVDSGTLPDAVAVGDVLIGVFGAVGQLFGVTPISVNDSLGNTWTQIVEQLQSIGFNAASASIWWTKATTAGTCTITVTSSTFEGCQSFVVIKAPPGVTSVDVSGGSNTSSNPALTLVGSTDFVVTGGLAVQATPTATSPETVVAYGMATFGYSAGSVTDIFGTVLAYVNASSPGAFTSSLYCDANAGGNTAAIVSAAFNVATPTPPVQTTSVNVNPQGTVTHSTGALTLNEPVFGNGVGDIKVGTKTGNTEQVQCASGSAGGTGAPLLYDSSGNAVAGVTGQLVPSGGTTGQVLTKNSATNFDDSWLTPTGSSPLTTKGDVYGYSTTNARIPVGSDGLVLTADSTQSLGVKWASAGASGDFVLLSSQVATSAAELDFTSVIDSTYDDYLIKFVGITVGTNSAAIGVQFSTDNGVTWDTATNYEWGQTNVVLTTGASGSNFQAATGAILLFADGSGGGLLSTATPGMSASAELYDPLSSVNFKFLDCQGMAEYYGNSLRYGWQTHGVYRNTTAVNALRVLPTTGVFSGTVRIYGIAK